ncbi:MAG: hypothetical protein QOI01_2061 [Mycobacterium sp.]|nr:hypothetical protein [Mycobacterium sp.]
MRSDDDTWDITTSVGSTALFVAAARALEAQKAEPLVLDPFAEVFCLAAGGEWADVLDGGEGDGAGRLRSDFGGHFVSFQAARTKYFERLFMPNRRTDSPVTHSDPGGLSTVMKSRASSDPKNHADQLSR